MALDLLLFEVAAVLAVAVLLLVSVCEFGLHLSFVGLAEFFGVRVNLVFFLELQLHFVDFVHRGAVPLLSALFVVQVVGLALVLVLLAQTVLIGFNAVSVATRLLLSVLMHVGQVRPGFLGLSVN